MNLHEKIQRHLDACPSTGTGCAHFLQDGTPKRNVTGLHIAGRRWFDRVN